MSERHGRTVCTFCDGQDWMHESSKRRSYEIRVEDGEGSENEPRFFSTHPV